MIKASIIIRTFNEGKYLDQLLRRISTQAFEGGYEVIVVDSGSTDETLRIAEKHRVKVVKIPKEQFTFGRSLNIGCAAAAGEYLVFISGHCIPTTQDWLELLCEPFQNQNVAITYGRQIGVEQTRFSEHQIFAKYFSEDSQIPQEGFFVNNANSAVRKSSWEKRNFNEELTGLEDLDFAKKATREGAKVAYVAGAVVEHIHDETWRKVMLRFEREALALRSIMPEVHLNLLDICRYFVVAVLSDSAVALSNRVFFKKFGDIVSYRFCQYVGAYLGHREHRKLSQVMKEKYFYPK